jgi:hypothetical protein
VLAFAKLADIPTSAPQMPFIDSFHFTTFMKNKIRHFRKYVNISNWSFAELNGQPKNMFAKNIQKQL